LAGFVLARTALPLRKGATRKPVAMSRGPALPFSGLFPGARCHGWLSGVGGCFTRGAPAGRWLELPWTGLSRACRLAPGFASVAAPVVGRARWLWHSPCLNNAFHTDGARRPLPMQGLQFCRVLLHFRVACGPAA